MKKITTLTLLSLVTISAAAQLSFTEIQIMPGAESSTPGRMKSINGTMYFQAHRKAEGTELWATDGTPAGTRFVKDLFPGVANSNPRNFTPCNGKVYFIADSLIVNNLWVTDGTTAGTQALKNSFQDGFMAIEYMAELNGKLIVTAKNATTGFELWESDGTSAGTKLLKDINPGQEHSNPGPYVLYNNKLYFRAFDGTSEEIWCTDGTATGTLKISNINYPGAVIRDLNVVNNSLCFTATNTNGRSLYKSDGTSAGTTHLVSLNTHKGYPHHTESVVIDNKLYFATDEGNYLEQLWATDGTSAGTVRLMKDPYHGTARNITAFNGKVYFVYSDKFGAYIYSTDGTAVSAGVAKAFSQYTIGNPFDNILSLTVYNGSLYFIAHSSHKSTMQLYAITFYKQILNIKPAGNTMSNTMFGTIQDLCVHNNKLWANASFNNNEGFELWSIEGTPTGISNTAVKVANAFILYPNPANHVLHVTTASTYKTARITITNAVGQIVLTENITYKNTISLQGIAPGIYTATIDADGIRETQLLTIQ